MTRKQELECFHIAGEVFAIAKKLSATYNALLVAEKECENITGIPYEEFKAWLDNTLTKLNESWNRQYDALMEGKSRDEIHRIGSAMAKDTLGRLFDEDILEGMFDDD